MTHIETTETCLQVSLDGPVAILTLDRPRAKNALNRDLMEALREQLAAFRRDEAIRAVVLTGANNTFCAGADITAFGAFREEPLIGEREAFGDLFWAELTTFPKPLIAAVEGLALGGGCEVALACDIVVTAENTKFGLPEVTLGVLPGAGGTQRLIRSVGKAKAMTMLLTGDFWTAEEAYNSGLASHLCPQGQALETAVGVGKRIARNSPLAAVLVKDAALRAFETPLAQGLEHEKRNFFVTIHSEDSREGQSAFLEKRPANFTGK